MEFTSDKIIRYLQDRLDTVAARSEAGLDAKSAIEEYIVCVQMAQEITGRKIASHNYKVAWED